MPLPSPRPDLLVVGLGPAGRALAHRASQAGLRTIAVDPRPRRQWTPTYGLWLDELPSWLESDVLRAVASAPRVWTTRERILHRPYGIIDNDAFQSALDLRDVQVVPGTALALTPHSATVRTPGDELPRELCAHVVIDARGARLAPQRAEQTAYGLTLPRDVAAPALQNSDSWIMDWRGDNGAAKGAPASFLYAVPVGDDRVLVEETCLVGRPALPLGELRTRLHHRLTARGVTLPTTADTERVHFAVEPGSTMTEVPLFGARGGLTHPGTGYSVAASLAAADELVHGLCAGLPPHAVLWPSRTRMVQRLRGMGLDALLALPPHRMGEFFDAFFDLPVADQRAYLSRRDDLTGTARAMWGQFRGVRSPLRWKLVRAASRSLTPFS